MKKLSGIIGLGLGLYVGKWVSGMSSFFLMDFTMYNIKNSDIPYYVYPIKFEDGCYPKINLSLVQNEKSQGLPFENAIWVTKNALGKYDPKKANDTVTNPFEVYAFRKIRFLPNSLSDQMINGCLGCLCDELMAG